MRLPLALPCIAALVVLSPSFAFQTNTRPRTPVTTPSALRYSNWDVFETRDAMELMIGGARYEMVELPDSMMSTTLWVGNLCEFVTDDMLSELFQQASSLKFVPACVARKPNMESLRYGFVTFRSEEEKEVSYDYLFKRLCHIFGLAMSTHRHSPVAFLESSNHVLVGKESPSWIRTARKMSQGRTH